MEKSNREKKHKEYIYDIFLVVINLIVPIELIRTGYRIKDFDYKFVLLIIIFSIILYIFYFEFYIKKLYKILPILAVFFLGTVFCLKNFQLVTQFIDKNIISAAIKIWPRIMQNAETNFKDYKYIIVIMLPTIVVLLIRLTKRKKKIILFLNSIFIILFWFLYQKETLNVVKVYLFITLVSVFITNYLNTKEDSIREKVKIRDSKILYLAYGCMICICVVTLVEIIPKNYKGISGNNYSKIFKNTFSGNLPIEMSLINEYGLTSSGYDERDKNLGGPLTINKTHVFDVKANEPYYLKGSIKEIYDGKKWTSKYEADSFIELKKDQQYNPIKFKKQDSLNNLSLRSIRITPNKNLKTTSFFMVEKTRKIRGALDKIYCNEIPVFLSSKKINNPYNVIFYTNPFEKEIFKSVEGYSNEEYENYNILPRKQWLDKSRLNYIDNSENSENNYIISNKYVDYLSIPFTVPKEVYDLTNEIIEGKYSNSEKVYAIKNYLNKNYPYSLEVSNIPQNEEFVDYFLFKEKKGYCTYFATTTTIMCRIAGIPARYVEGFKIDEKSKNDKGEYEVTNGEAHAWCEILSNPKDCTWKIVDSTSTPTEWERSIEKEKKEIEVDSKNNNEKNVERVDKNMSTIEDLETDSNEFFNLYDEKMVKNIFPIISILFYILIKIIKNIKWKKHMYSCDSIIPVYNFYLFRLSSIGIKKDDSMGDLEFLKSLKDDELREKMNFLVNESYKEFYGELKYEEINKIEYIRFIENYIKSKERKSQYWLKRYFSKI
ncbi:transglutaminase domain-containing protein [Clostridium senegalense]|uniref:Transglutaminase domain-containing protein n=1 Tax=Clostridium senegalense TaxID=1465809 RepID=A0A6M0GYY4_9CLOT|nr:transglutaminase domain-containing protein [Clostridium senegalense]